jgi:uncharacterized membrane protein YozB (DUF420 family)
MLEVIFVVLMMFWLFFGSYMSWDRDKPYGLGTTIIPWLCVAILGWLVFNGNMNIPVNHVR